jgi:NADPH:quinone reductase-like Zn-dependent oxidoreductase
LAEWVEAGTIKPNIDRVYDLNEFDLAIQDMNEGRIRGKAVISISQDE